MKVIKMNYSNHKKKEKFAIVDILNYYEYKKIYLLNF